MRLTTIRSEGEEVTAVILAPGGAVSVGEIHDPLGSGWPADLLSLLQSGQFYELWRFYDGMTEKEVEKLSAGSRLR